MKKSQVMVLAIVISIIPFCIAFGIINADHSVLWSIGSVVVAFTFNKAVDTMEEDQ